MQCRGLRSARCRQSHRSAAPSGAPSSNLPQPDSPTMPSVSPRLTVRRHVLDGVDDALRAREDALPATGKCFVRCRPRPAGRRPVWVSGESCCGSCGHIRRRRTDHRSHHAQLDADALDQISRFRSAGRWQASKCPPGIAASGGSSLSQGRSGTCSEGGTDSPGGGAISEGGEPSIATSRSSRRSTVRHRLEQAPRVR